MNTFFTLLPSLFRRGRTRNYSGILSMTYRWGSEDRQEKGLHRTERLRRKMLDLVSAQRKAHIRERIQFLSDNFLNNSNHGKNE